MFLTAVDGRQNGNVNAKYRMYIGIPSIGQRTPKRFNYLFDNI